MATSMFGAVTYRIFAPLLKAISSHLLPVLPTVIDNTSHTLSCRFYVVQILHTLLRSVEYQNIKSVNEKEETNSHPAA